MAAQVQRRESRDALLCGLLRWWDLCLVCIVEKRLLEETCVLLVLLFLLLSCGIVRECEQICCFMQQFAAEQATHPDLNSNLLR